MSIFFWSGISVLFQIIHGPFQRRNFPIKMKAQQHLKSPLSTKEQHFLCRCKKNIVVDTKHDFSRECFLFDHFRGICGTWCQRQLSCPGTQVWSSACDRWRWQKSQFVGRGQTELHHGKQPHLFSNINSTKNLHNVITPEIRTRVIRK